MQRTSYLFIFLLIPLFCISQEIIELPVAEQSAVQWSGDAQEYFESDWKTKVVTNVSQPSMQVFQADASISNGSAVIIAPGGGLFALAIEKEGNEVARWLNAKGITAFVLKYRLLPTGENGVQEVMKEPEKVIEKVKPILPLSIADGQNALAYVKENASRWGVDTDKVGFMGFSAGGAVTMGVALNSLEEKAPAFIVPVYAWMPVIGEYEIPEDLPPMLVICASDDPLMLAPDSVSLYSNWVDEGGKAELHMYSQGGHGFGMEAQGLPSDDWISRFYEWAVSEKLVASNNPQ